MLHSATIAVAKGVIAFELYVVMCRVKADVQSVKLVVSKLLVFGVWIRPQSSGRL
jgi:hypothetical protein